MKRLKASLCPGMFAYADEQLATQILDECLKICGGSAETLSAVIQTKFFVGHTLFYWLIIKRHSKSGTPPLFTELLSVCESLDIATQEEIADAFWKEYDSDLYVAVKDKLISVPTHEAYTTSEFFLDEGDQPAITSSGPRTGSVKFRIPKFFDRILVDEKITFVFLTLGVV